jgi:carbon-monoxide dehydrogenase small subunit
MAEHGNARIGPRLDVSFTLNGQPVTVPTATSTTLADLLRARQGNRGTKIACDRAVCGACTVLIDGVPRASCSVFAFEAAGAVVQTVEGLAEDGDLNPVQAAFADNSAFQCGFCTAGMILLTEALLAHDPDPDEPTIKDWISSNICRCTGYTLILEAVRDAAKRKQAQSGRGAAQ